MYRSIFTYYHHPNFNPVLGRYTAHTHTPTHGNRHRHRRSCRRAIQYLVQLLSIFLFHLLNLSPSLSLSRSLSRSINYNTLKTSRHSYQSSIRCERSAEWRIMFSHATHPKRRSTENEATDKRKRRRKKTIHFRCR